MTSAEAKLPPAFSKLTPEFVAVVHLAAPRDVGMVPHGQRGIVEILGGTVTGEKINGEILTGGSDWLLVGNDGFARLDVRMQIQTSDGAIVYFQSNGLLELNTASMTASMAGADSSKDDYYHRELVRLEAASEQYSWLNTRLWIAESRFVKPPQNIANCAQAIELLVLRLD